ncbi:MAG: hypothetical protein ACOC56_05870 [Atribacterota bacterium]
MNNKEQDLISHDMAFDILSRSVEGWTLEKTVFVDIYRHFTGLEIWVCDGPFYKKYVFRSVVGKTVISTPLRRGQRKKLKKLIDLIECVEMNRQYRDD